MEAGLVVLIAVLAVVFGLLVGFIFSRTIWKRKKSIGSLIVVEDNDGHGDPYLYLQLDESPNTVMKSRTVVLTIKHISQK